MTSELPLTETQEITPKVKYPIYLIVADDSNEFDAALNYAGFAAKHNNARLAVLHILDKEASLFMPWSMVRDRLEVAEQEEGKRVLDKIASRLDQYGLTPSLYLRHGKAIDVVKDLISEDHNIVKLILAADTEHRNPGPLVSYFTGRGLREISVPVTIVPGHATLENVREMYFD